MAKPTLHELKIKYSQKCYEIGDLEFKLRQIPTEIDVVHSQLNVIFKEMIKATDEEQKKNAQAQQAPAPKTDILPEASV